MIFLNLNPFPFSNEIISPSCYFFSTYICKTPNCVFLSWGHSELTFLISAYFRGWEYRKSCQIGNHSAKINTILIALKSKTGKGDAKFPSIFPSLSIPSLILFQPFHNRDWTCSRKPSLAWARTQLSLWSIQSLNSHFFIYLLSTFSLTFQVWYSLFSSPPFIASPCLSSHSNLQGFRNLKSQKIDWISAVWTESLGSQRPEWEMMRTLIFWDSSGTSDADLFTWVISQTPTYSLKHQAKTKPEVALFTIAQTWKQSKCPSASSGRQTH